MLDRDSRNQLGLEISRKFFSKENEKFDYFAFRYALENGVNSIAPPTPDQIFEKYENLKDVKDLDKPMESDRWKYSLNDVDKLISWAIEETLLAKERKKNESEEASKIVSVGKLLTSNYSGSRLPILEYPPFEVPPNLIPTPFFSETHYIVSPIHHLL